VLRYEGFQGTKSFITGKDELGDESGISVHYMIRNFERD